MMRFTCDLQKLHKVPFAIYFLYIAYYTKTQILNSYKLLCNFTKHISWIWNLLNENSQS